MRDEIIAGIKNAMERGYSLNQAMQSFINAGYNPQEVMAAGKMLSSGATSIIYPEKDYSEAKKEEKNSTSSLPKNSIPSLPKTSNPSLEEKTNGKKKMLIIAIIVALVIFLGALGFLIYTLVK